MALRLCSKHYINISHEGVDLKMTKSVSSVSINPYLRVDRCVFGFVICIFLSPKPQPATLSHLRCIKYLRQHNELQVLALVRAEWREGHLLFVVWRQREWAKN